MNALEMPSVSDETLERLERHRQRRSQRVPTLSVLVGSGEMGRRLVCRWAVGSNLLVVESQATTPTELVAAWFAKLAGSRNLAGVACTWLSARTGRPAGELSHGLGARSPAERMLFLERLCGGSAAAEPEKVCQTILEHMYQQGSTSVGLWERLLAACQHNARKLLAGLIELVGADLAPVLLVDLPVTNDQDALRTAFDSLAALMVAAPACCAAALIDPVRLQLCLAQMPESRAMALVREGLITVPVAESEDSPAGDVGAGPPSDDDADDERRSDRSADPARSHAERYLFERLEVHPETAGLFELNGRISPTIAPGRRRKIDLLARSVRVAVEIDGYYHFTDLDAYRRDRQKDVLLQHEGYLVVRCLADDVVAHFEDILQTIVEAVRLRRPAQLRGQENST